MPRTMSTISLFSASSFFCSNSFSRACCSLILALTLSISAWIFAFCRCHSKPPFKANARRRRNETASSLYLSLHNRWDRHNGASACHPHRSHNGKPRRVISALEKDQIAGARGCWSAYRCYRAPGPQAAHIPAGMIDHPGHKAGAVKGRGWAGAAPYIGIADIFPPRREWRQRFRHPDIPRGTSYPSGVVSLADILGAWEQIRAVSQR